jgi:hypothetical protein
MFVVVVFLHNTVKSYVKVTDHQILKTFMDACKHVNQRADLDLRDSFISYSDDNVMVQLIGPITSNIVLMIVNAINDMRSNFQ